MVARPIRAGGVLPWPQVHDEVILEGPKENADDALHHVKDCMQKPFKGQNLLRVELDVSAGYADNWCGGIPCCAKATLNTWLLLRLLWSPCLMPTAHRRRYLAK